MRLALVVAALVAVETLVAAPALAEPLGQVLPLREALATGLGDRSLP